MGPELEQIKQLYDLMLETNLDSIEIKEEDLHIKLTRRSANAHPASWPHDETLARPAPPSAGVDVSAQAAPEESEANGIQAPLAGVFYRAASPTSAPFVKEGDVVEPGQTLCIVEAMKVMNEIKAETPCKIVKILVENGRPVAAGQILFRIESA